MISRRELNARRVAKRAARATEKSVSEFKTKTEALGRAAGYSKKTGENK